MAASAPRRPRRSRRVTPHLLDRINPDAAGIDCGATTHVVAVPPDRDTEPVQSFRTSRPISSGSPIGSSRVA
jgi:hypothetical protein